MNNQQHYGSMNGQVGMVSPMIGNGGQSGPEHYLGTQMPGYSSTMQHNGYQAPQAQQYHQPEKPKSTVVEVIRSNYTTIALFEVSGNYDPAQQFPKALCFVMGVPGVKDASKQSGRSYVQANKIVMKFSTQEIRSLGQSLINISTFKQAAPAFEKHSDPSKNTYTQNNGQQQNTKKLKASYDQSRNNIVITMNFGANNVMIPVPLQDAMGLGHDLINIGNVADTKLAEYKIANRIGKEEITGIDYDPEGATDLPGQNGMMQPSYGQPQGTQGMPGMTGMPGQPQGMPGQFAHFQNQQMVGYPGAQ